MQHNFILIEEPLLLPRFTRKSKGFCIVKLPFFSMREVPELFIVTFSTFALVPYIIIINKKLSRGLFLWIELSACVVTYIFTSHPVAFYQRGRRRGQRRWMILKWMKTENMLLHILPLFVSLSNCDSMSWMAVCFCREDFSLCQ